MKIFIGADHRGFFLKKKIVKFLRDKGHAVIDVGIGVAGKICDYPYVSRKVALAVTKSKDGRGILACLTGIGHSIAANKIPGTRATLCYTPKAAFLSRAHNDSNILIIGAKFVNKRDILKIVDVWLKTEFEGGRHRRRVNQIKRIEKEICKR